MRPSPFAGPTRRTSLRSSWSGPVLNTRRSPATSGFGWRRSRSEPPAMADPARANPRDFEVIVVGGGPAGSSTAAVLADAGHRVLVLDKASFPRHKACSDYVNPAGARLLAGMGLRDDLMHAGAHTMEGMLVHAPN